MDLKKKISDLCKRKLITINDLANKIDMSPTGLYYSIRNDVLKVSTLQKIADVLEVPITSFFDDEKTKLLNKQIEDMIRIDKSVNKFVKAFFIKYSPDFTFTHSILKESVIDSNKLYKLLKELLPDDTFDFQDYIDFMNFYTKYNI